MKSWAALFVASFALSASAQVPTPHSHGPPVFKSNFEEEAPWREQQEVELPAFPKQENLREFYVSPTATNKYLIDASSLTVGTDEVVRYVLVVQTAGGATNISFEGIHCKERNWKHYATGRSDGTWTRSKAARVEWRQIENKPVNRHHAALSRDMFCPAGSAIQTADEGRNALRMGKHPNAN